MFPINNNPSSSHIAAIQIVEAGNTSPPIDSQLVQQIRYVIALIISNCRRLQRIEEQNRVRRNRLAPSMQCTNVRSEDEQLVPNMTLNMTVNVDPKISFYPQSNTPFTSGGNNSVSPLIHPNFDLAEQAARSRASSLSTGGSDTNFSFDPLDLERLTAKIAR